MSKLNRVIDLYRQRHYVASGYIANYPRKLTDFPFILKGNKSIRLDKYKIKPDMEDLYVFHSSCNVIGVGNAATYLSLNNSGKTISAPIFSESSLKDKNGLRPIMLKELSVKSIIRLLWLRISYDLKLIKINFME